MTNRPSILPSEKLTNTIGFIDIASLLNRNILGTDAGKKINKYVGLVEELKQM